MMIKWILRKMQSFWVWLPTSKIFGKWLPISLAVLLSLALFLHILFEISKTECKEVVINHEGNLTAIECERDSFFLKKAIETISSGDARNLGLLLAASIGWIFFHWRARSADQDVKIAEQGLTADRLTRAIEHLAHDKTSIRSGGIRSLEQIAKSYEEEREKIIQILSVRIREIAPLDATKETKEWLQRLEDENERKRLATEERYKRSDVETIAKVLSDITRINPYRLCELRDIDLSGLFFAGGNFANCFFSGANMSHAIFFDVDFSNANLEGVNISRASFILPRGLTQEQANQTFCYKGYEPIAFPPGLELPREIDFPQNR